jgi:hypothetical protein
MRVEVHVHGSLFLRHGVSLTQVEAALARLLDYLDADNFAEIKSFEPDEPGFAFDSNERVLDICWTGEVGRNFAHILQESLLDSGPLLEQACEIEVTFYYDDGRQEYQLCFTGPTPEAVHAAQRKRMVDDVVGLVSRHFGKEDVAEVEALMNRLFDRDWENQATQGDAAAVDFEEKSGSLIHFRKRHLH